MNLVPVHPSSEMGDLRLDSSSESDTDSCGSSHRNSSKSSARFDEFGRPRVRPLYKAIGESSVLSRARDFLPIFRDATLKLSDPQIQSQLDSHVKIPSSHLVDGELESNSDESESSFGVEIDVGLGVFDVNGSVDEKSIIKQGIPVLSEPVPERAPGSLDNPQTPLIQEIDYR